MGRCARIRLTKTLIEAAGPGWLWDSDTPGLGVRVLASGVRSFVFRYRGGPSGRRMTLGKFGAWTLDQARKKARKLLGAVADDRDPALEAQRARGGPTVAEAFERYEAEYSKIHKRPASVERDAAGMRLNVLPAIGTKPMRLVTRADVEKLHLACNEKRASGNRALAVLSHLYGWAADHQLVPEGTNPTRRVRRYREPPRQRYLSVDEFKRLGEVLATRTELYPTAALRVLMLTGARLGEVLSLRWPDVDFERGGARLTSRKAGPLWLKLPAQAIEVIRGLPGQETARQWVFPGRPKPRDVRSHLTASGMETYWQSVRKAAKLEGVRLHDLRHSYASVGAGMGMSLHQLGELLGHSQASTTQRYAHLEAGSQSALANAVADAIAEALKPKG